MKKLIFTLFSLIVFQIGFSQTYYWVGGATATSFSSASNWNDQLGGGGNPLPASITGTNSQTFTFIVSGLDISSAAGTQTGPININFSGTINMGQLFLENLADVTFSRTTASSGTTTVTLVGGTGDDFVVNPFCKLTLKGLTGSMLVSVGASATAAISGDLVLDEGATATYNNRFTAATKNSFLIKTGGTVTANATYASYPFNTLSSSTPAGQNSVVFESGSAYYFNGGLSPFGSTTASCIVQFKPGSTFYFKAQAAPNMFNSRVYGDVIVDYAALTGNGSLIQMDNLTVTPTATFIIDTSGTTAINGNITNNGAIMEPTVNPYRNGKLLMINSATKTIGGSGTYTLGDFIISNQSTATLQKSIQVDSLTRVIGTLNPAGFSLTGGGVTTTKLSASFNVIGITVIDSMLVKAVSDLTNIEVGMSVSGTGIPANTVVTSISTTNSTITLSNPATASGTPSLTIFNGQGVVLPVRFSNITANQANGKTTVSWEVYTEQEIVRYEVQRSANGTEFSSIGTVSASGGRTYNYIDAAPLSSVNYYRIKAVSRDGQVNYSNIVRVNNKNKQELSVYPNPVQGKTINLSANGLTKGQYNLIIVNAGGQQVFNKSLGTLSENYNAAIDLPLLSPGMYTLIIRSSETQLQQAMIVK